MNQSAHSCLPRRRAFLFVAAIFLCGFLASGFSAQNTAATVSVGQSCTFSVTADGTAPFSYQWYHDSVLIPGATGAVYATSNVKAADAGVYHAIVANAAGSAVSDPVTLGVVAAPSFSIHPSGGSIVEGASVKFTAAADGTPAPTYQWRRNGAVIPGATGTSFSLASVTIADAGTYTVLASNSAGTTSSNGAVLTVTAKAAASSAPVFTSQPASQAVKKGLPVTFTAIATGTPAPSYQWRRNGSVIKGATGASYTIAKVDTANAGTYTVVATNSAGSLTSNGAVLTVTTHAAALSRVDFNADDKTDILWQNLVTGELAIWFMDGVRPGDAVAIGAFPGSWKICGVADFNGDGDPDLLCINATTGEASIALMSGLAVSSQVSLGVQPETTRIAGIGDYNGDHRPDILVQDTVTGKISAWLMAGTTRSSVASIGSVSTDWQVVAGGDFNADGKSSFLLQNMTTGQINLWLLSGTKVTWKAWVANQPIEWQASGTGDFNGDGKSDVLWQNVLTGECSLWIMSGNVVKQRLPLGTRPVDWVMRN